VGTSSDRVLRRSPQLPAGPAGTGFAWERSGLKPAHSQHRQLPAPSKPTLAMVRMICSPNPVCVPAHVSASLTWDRHGTQRSDNIHGAPFSAAQQIHTNHFLITIKRAQTLLSHRASVLPQRNSRACFTSAALFSYKRLKAKLKKRTYCYTLA